MANLYWQYFNQHRWQFYNRTKTSEKIDAEDFRNSLLNIPHEKRIETGLNDIVNTIFEDPSFKPATVSSWYSALDNDFSENRTKNIFLNRFLLLGPWYYLNQSIALFASLLILLFFGAHKPVYEDH